MKKILSMLFICLFIVTGCQSKPKVNENASKDIREYINNSLEIVKDTEDKDEAMDDMFQNDETKEFTLGVSDSLVGIADEDEYDELIVDLRKKLQDSVEFKVAKVENEVVDKEVIYDATIFFAPMNLSAYSTEYSSDYISVYYDLVSAIYPDMSDADKNKLANELMLDDESFLEVPVLGKIFVRDYIDYFTKVFTYSDMVDDNSPELSSDDVYFQLNLQFKYDGDDVVLLEANGDEVESEDDLIDYLYDNNYISTISSNFDKEIEKNPKNFKNDKFKLELLDQEEEKK